MMNSWKINLPNDYRHLIDMFDTPYNGTAQVRQIVFGTDCSKGNTLIQDQEARDLERPQLYSFNDIVKFCQSYITLAANKGSAFLGPELSKKWYSKQIKPLGDLIYKSWIDQGNENIVGIGPVI